MNASPARDLSVDTLPASALDYIKRLAPAYIWWKKPEEALRYPYRLIAQIMDMGTFEDVQALVAELGTDRLASVVRQAEIGWFRPQSWSYWNYRLGLVDVTDNPPPMPKRRLG